MPSREFLCIPFSLPYPLTFSQGEPAAFQYRVSWKKNAAIKSITLESGDALIFGGKSRGIIHRVPGLGCRDPSTVLKPTGVPADTRRHSGRGVSKDAPLLLTQGEGAGSLNVPDGGRYNLNFREL